VAILQVVVECTIPVVEPFAKLDDLSRLLVLDDVFYGDSEIVQSSEHVMVVVCSDRFRLGRAVVDTLVSRRFRGCTM
jgi:hypothetical protein